jgi:Cu(I)/Ag(I) efflux system membrane protein CusA/SilA
VIERVIEFSARSKFLVLILIGIGVVGAIWCLHHVPLDAIPDLSDTQVIIYSRWDRSPDIIEDQVTYPIIASLLGAPRVKDIRGSSDFGFSYVSVIFEDGTDLYWARSRTLEYLQKIQSRLPKGVATELGPDATGVGWVYQYALTDQSGKNSLADLRSFQDWRLRYWLQSVPGVAEVASVGGFQKQYQVNLEPQKLLAYNVPILKVLNAIREGNNDTGGRLVELAGAEYMVRGRGYARSVEEIENIGVGADRNGVPILVKNLGRVALGPEIRRGVGELDGMGQTVGGIVVMRQGENALQVIDRVKARIEELKPSFPAGMEIVPVYDRSGLIQRSISTLTHELIAALVVVSLVILIFLWHIPSAIVPIITIPVSVLLAFIPMYFLGVTANIMSLAGIAISIGVLVDGAVVEVENAYKKLQLWNQTGRQGDYHQMRLQALKEVGPSVFFSLLVIAVAFIPIFALEEQEGRLFKPLAYTKNLTIAIAAFLAITLDPAVRMLFTRMDPFRFRPLWLSWIFTRVAVGTYYPEEKHPISRALFWLYERPCRFVIRHRFATLVVAAALVLTTIPVYLKLGSEFMPPLWEGDLLYMPTSAPGISVTEAAKLIQRTDQVLMSFPEVQRVFGKIGRADTSTDPAPFSMVETTVMLKPPSFWRKRERWYSGWPAWLQAPLRQLWPDHLTKDELIEEMDGALKVPGMGNSWLMPIENRVNMLLTGARTPIAVKVQGSDLKKIEEIAIQVEGLLRKLNLIAFADRTAGGYYLDFDLKREKLARYGVSVEEAEMVIGSAIGGEPLTTTIEGRERYTVSVRYARELRDDLPDLERVLVPAMSGAQVPLGELADLRLVYAPSMIKDEGGLLTGVVSVVAASSDIGGEVERAREAVRGAVSLPPGYSLRWSGLYESMVRVKERLKVVVPVTLVLIFIILYLNTRSAVKASIVLLAVPFSAIGAVWFVYLLGYNVSIAVWVGIIALMGLDAETGVFMLLFLDLAYQERVREGKMRTFEDLTEAIVYGAVKRIRPKLMTVACAFIGLLPILWSQGSGADMMKRVAAPLMGGLITSFILELLVYPAIYAIWKWRFEMKEGAVDVSTLPLPELRGH